MKREDFRKKYSKKTHLGDGLYVSFDGYHFILMAERKNGWHWVGLEPDVFHNFIHYRKQVYADAEHIDKES